MAHTPVLILSLSKDAPSSSRSDAAECVGRRPAMRLAFMALAATALAACGMKGDPQVPAEAGRRVPRQYPAK
jgi:hypothetical protein